MVIYLHMRVAKYCVTKARDVIRVEIGCNIVLLSQSHLHGLFCPLRQHIEHHHSLFGSLSQALSGSFSGSLRLSLALSLALFDSFWLSLLALSLSLSGSLWLPTLLVGWQNF